MQNNNDSITQAISAEALVRLFASLPSSARDARSLGEFESLRQSGASPVELSSALKVFAAGLQAGSLIDDQQLQSFENRVSEVCKR